MANRGAFKSAKSVSTNSFANCVVTGALILVHTDDKLLYFRAENRVTVTGIIPEAGKDAQMPFQKNQRILQ